MSFRYTGRVSHGLNAGSVRDITAGFGAIISDSIVMVRERDEEGWYFIVMANGLQWWLKDMPPFVEDHFRIAFCIPPLNRQTESQDSPHSPESQDSPPTSSDAP